MPGHRVRILADDDLVGAQLLCVGDLAFGGGELDDMRAERVGKLEAM
jgi:hypothetical protein